MRVSQNEQTQTDLIGRAVSREGGMAYRANADAGLEAVTCESQSGRIGTLSFPVCNGAPIHKNRHRIEEILRRRGPALLLCAVVGSRY